MSADGRPGPGEAYALWTGACARAGWRSGPQPEQVPVADALGRVTFEPVRARWPAPRFACAAMDGVAVSAAALTAAAQARVPLRLAPGAFSWIDTGDPVPAFADTVVQREQVRQQPDGSVVVPGPVTAGHHVRAAGEDFAAGQELVPAGRRLRPGDLGAATAAGLVALAVARQPQVAIIPTGDEIRPAGTVPAVGEIIDSNSVMLAARVRQSGALPLVSAVQPDDPDKIVAAVRAAARTADLVLVIAGSSAGRDDHTAAVLAQAGQLTVRGVAVRPGHPVLLGSAKAGQVRPGQPAGTVPVIGLPGYPLAAAVIFELFAAPLLAALLGLAPPQDGEATRPVRLARDFSSPHDVEDWVLVTVRGGVATPARRGASATSQLAGADAWWRIPIGQGAFSRGQQIDVQPIPAGVL